MRRLILILYFVNATLMSFAQIDSEHLSFKGVPIDGTLNEYVSKMKTAGFSYLGTQDGTAILPRRFRRFQKLYGRRVHAESRKCSQYNRCDISLSRRLEFSRKRLRSP